MDAAARTQESMPRLPSFSGYSALAVALSLPMLLDGCGWARPPQATETRRVVSPVVVDPVASRKLSPADAREAIDDAVAARDYQERATQLATAIQAATHVPLMVGNQTRLLVDGPQTFEAIFDAVRVARDHVHIETYIFDDDAMGRRFGDLLIAKRREGVDVRIIYDVVGSLRSSEGFFDSLREHGIEVLRFRPLDPVHIWKINNRDHRKLVIVDGRVAFTGGANISNAYSSGSTASPGPERGREEAWRDTQVEIRGPAVRRMQDIFLHTWRRLGGEVDESARLYPKLEKVGDHLVAAVAGEGGDDYEFNLYDHYLAAIRNARDRIWITQAYFAPDDRLREALAAAVVRGVDVRVILPSFTDSQLIFYASRGGYDELLAQGIRLFEFSGALLHSKTSVIDGVWSTVGSCNIDVRSFAHNNELDAAILARDFARSMEALFRRDLSRSKELVLEEWNRRPLPERVKERLSGLFSYWL